MKMSKLLSGAAAVALLGGAAYADPEVDTVNGSATGAVFANELDLSSAPQALTLEGVDVAPDGSSQLAAIQGIGVTDDIDVVITLTGDLSWSENLDSSNFVGTSAACELSVDDDGFAGGQTVTYSSVTNTAFNPTLCTAGLLEFEFPVNAAGVGGLDVAINLRATSAPLGSGSAAMAGGEPLVSQADGFEFSASGSDATISLNDAYQLFLDGTTATSAAIVGSVSFAAVANVAFAANSSGFVDVDAGSASQIDEITATFSVPQPAGIASVRFNGSTAAVDVSTGEAVVSFTGDVGTSEVELIAASGTDAAAIANQTIGVDFAVTPASGSNLSFDPQSETLGSLTREGSSVEFEWVGGSAAATASILRLTGLDESALPRILVSISNAIDGDGNAYTAPEAELAYTSAPNGELIITGSMLNSALGDFLRGDISITVEQDDVTVRRFGFNASGGLTDFSFDPSDSE